MAILILLYAFHVILVFGIVILIQFSDNFNYCIRALLVCCLLQALAIIFQIGTPVGLLYGPLLHLAGQAARGKADKKTNRLHFIPFFVFTIFYSILFSGINTAAGRNIWFLSHYYPAYFIAMALSLVVYPAVMIFQRKKETQVDPLEEVILIQLSSLQLILAALIALLYTGMFHRLSFSYPPQFLTYAILGIGIIILLRYLYYAEGKKDLAATTSNSLVRTAADESLAGYAEKIQQCLSETKIYLRPNLSLEMLSQETGIPKTIFSEVLNAYIGKSFYQLTAEYRIKHALNLLNGDNQNYTVEALAYECGFNSKTSFNRYFKEYTGFKPSEYRSKQLK